MIEGLKLRVPSAELREHCVARAAYHCERADVKAKELPALKDAMEAIKAGGGKAAETIARMSKGGYNFNADSPVDSLEQDIRDHKNRALVFQFYADHLFEEDYTLEKDDLVRLEILKNW